MRLVKSPASPTNQSTRIQTRWQVPALPSAAECRGARIVQASLNAASNLKRCGFDHFFLGGKLPSLIAAYAPTKKPMKLEPIVMIHGGSISDTTPMSMSQACRTAPPIVPASQKANQRTRMSVACRASFIAAPKGPVPKYALERHQA